MPLHLLGKKSWNVYNADNIARVRRDEAAAKAAEEAEEQRMQEVDAERRIAILRGEVPPPIEDVEETMKTELAAGTREDAHSGSMRRKRKRQGEDDTDFELRIAREKNELSVAPLATERKPTSSAPIVDHAGHIDLFGDEKLRAHAEKNEEAEKEAKKKKQSFEDQYTMRFSNAAGKDGIVKPWYSQNDDGGKQVAVMKDVWGNEDPTRKDRDTKRIVSNDPLAMMKQGASKVRELKKDRKQFQEEQAEQLKQLRREERHRERRQRRHEERDRDRDRERDRSPRRSERRHRSRERRYDEDDREGSRGEKRKPDRDGSRDHRRSHYRRDESREGRRDRRGRDGERHRTRDSRSPRRRDERDRHREPR